MYANPRRIARRDAIPAFLQYANRRLKPFGTRISAAVFGLRQLVTSESAGHRVTARYLDAVYPMTYPSLFGPGVFALADPSASPGATVSLALRHFRRAVRGRDVLLVPWIQDFSFERPYGFDEVRAQIDAARLAGAKGFMLWNAEGVYTDGVLTPS
jgi:hypothetical protein